MTRAHPVVAACAVLVLAASACSGSADIAQNGPSTTGTVTSPHGGSTSPSDPAASSSDTAGRLDGSGYSVAVPAGWTDITSSLKPNNPSLDLAMGETKTSGFRTNFNVVNSPGNPGSISSNGPAIRAEAAKELHQITHTAVRRLPDGTIDGEPAIGQTSTFNSAGTSVTFLQYLTVHQGHGYPVTMTFATSDRKAATKTFEQILSSWQWNR